MQPRYYQSEAVAAFFKFYADGNVGNPLIAMPTGTGKALVIAMLICEIVRRYRSQRIVMLTHVKELIAQNYATLLRVWPTAPAGIYSAGLDRKDAGFPITYGGIGSVHKKAHVFQKTNIIVIDEAHLLGPDEEAMYREFIDAIKKFNPHLIVVGLTATPFRLKQGMLTQGDNPLFTHIVYDLTGIEPFNRLIAEGFLSPLFPTRTDEELDITDLKLGSNGDFQVKDMEARYANDKVLVRALDEAVRKGSQRKRWLIFASGVSSCHKISHLLNTRYGVECRPVHSTTKDFPMTGKERDANIDAFKKGEVRALVNNNVLTTGFDCPEVDLIIMLRPTSSPGLWVQMLGRGTRPHPSKLNCLVLDFAGNTKRLGPINDPVIPYPKSRKGSTPREAPVKVCPNCGLYAHAAARVCAQCGFEFPRITKINAEAGDLALIATKELRIEVFPIKGVEYEKHTARKNNIDSLQINYRVSLIRTFKHWACFDHGEPSGHKARVWWRKASMTGLEAPKSVEEALSRTSELMIPTHVRVRLDKDHPQIMDIDYTGTAFGSL